MMKFNTWIFLANTLAVMVIVLVCMAALLTGCETTKPKEPVCPNAFIYLENTLPWTKQDEASFVLACGTCRTTYQGELVRFYRNAPGAYRAICKGN